MQPNGLIYLVIAIEDFAAAQFVFSGASEEATQEG
jgi:hypothetical protein